MGRAAVLVLALVGCFSPTPPAGAPCGEGDVCPSGLVCRQGVCVTDGANPDGPGPDTILPGAWAHVASGAVGTCAIDSQSGLWCWGDNAVGTLGIGDPAVREQTRPLRVGSAAWRSISCESSTCCGVQADESAWCWGSNLDGQIGIDPVSVAAAFEPMPVAGQWSAVVVGGSHTCGIRTDGGLACWGSNATGQLGTGGASTPVPQLLPGAWRQVAPGASTTCAIRTDDTLWCWGNNSVGQIGDGAPGDVRIEPARVNIGPVTEVGVGFLTACAVTAEQKVFCWGSNAYGALGVEGVDMSPVPLQVAGGPWTDLVVGGFVACAHGASGDVDCWGNDTYGQLALGGSLATPRPTRAPNLPPVETLEDFGLITSCTVTRDGALYCTGYDAFGGLGTGAGGSVMTPRQVEGSYTRIATATNSTCAVTTATGLACWGDNDSLLYEQAGTYATQAPLLVRPSGIIGVALGRQFHLEIRDNGAVYCTGQNQNHECGTVTGPQTMPVRVGGFNARAISANGHACALPRQGTGLTCWGLNDEGQLGQGNRDPYPSPVQALPTVTLVAVAAGYAHTCAVDEPGNLRCVGGGEHGQLGVGELMDRTSFVTVEGEWLGVTTGFAFTCAIDESEHLWCWGDNAAGQLGIGTQEMQTTPREVMPMTKVVAASAGANHACAIDDTGALWCWGFNVRGELGDGTFAMHTSPVRVGTATDWTAIAAGQGYTCGLRGSSDLYCWGLNQTGQIGVGTAWRGSWESL